MTEKKSCHENPVLVVRDLQTHFFIEKKILKAVNGVSFTLNRGEILGVVGESGSGKSMLCYSLMGLVDPPGKIVGGTILLDNIELTSMSEKNLRGYRGKRISMIFQDSMMALDPLMRIAGQMTEALVVHQKTGRKQALARARAALLKVGIADPDKRLRSYPHELSGGMRQRIAIAIAMLNQPDIIIADEPTTALDVTIQGQILAEMQHLVRQENIAIIWVTHDLPLVANLAHRVAVMYAGRIVETGLTDDVLDSPQHPYTQELIKNTPGHNAGLGSSRQTTEFLSPPVASDRGCSFRKRCSFVSDECLLSLPVRTFVSGHMVSCCHPLGKKPETMETV